MQKHINDAHSYLHANMNWYKGWHNNPLHGFYHWVFLIKVALLVAVAALPLSTQIVQSQTIAAQLNESKPAPAIAKGGKAGRAKDRILVRFKSNVDTKKKDSILSRKKLREQRDLTSIRVKVIEIPEGSTPEETIASLVKDDKDSIEFAEVDELLEPAFIPNDPNLSAQWSHPLIDSLTAWDSVTANNIGPIIIGISDTGVNCDHPDLVGKCVPGWNFYDKNSDTRDVYGHGTKVAGTAAAIGNNSIGGAGTAWGAKIMPLRISDTSGMAYSSTIAQSIIWAADNGAKVVNNSYALSGTTVVANAAAYLKSKGGVFVASSGNGGIDVISEDHPDMIIAGATDQNDQKFSWSNSGMFVDLVAPGCAGSTTLSAGGYGDGCGTSYSAPIIAGAFAVLFAVNPSLTPTQAAQIMFDTAKDLGAPGRDALYGAGRVNLAAAVARAKGGSTPTPPAPTEPTPPTTPPADTTTPSVPSNVKAIAVDSKTVNITWNASTDNVGVTGYKVYRASTEMASVNNTSYTDVTVAENTTYAYSVLAYDAAGNVSAKSAAVSVNVPKAPDTTAPSIPQNLKATLDTTGKINLSWNASTDNIGVSGYRVYKDDIEAASVTGTNYTDAAVNASITYKYAVVAYDAAGNTSQQSAVVTATVPAPAATTDTTAPSVPSNVKANATTTKVTLTWTASTDNKAVVGYKVYKSNSQVGTPTTTEYSDSSVNSGSKYSYTVAAYDAAGNTSAKSSAVSVTVPKPVEVAVGRINESNITSNSATLSWTTNIPSNASVYYGTSIFSLNSSATDGVISTNHSVTLKNLRYSDTYYYKITVTAEDGSSKKTTSVGSFTTKRR